MRRYKLETAVGALLVFVTAAAFWYVRACEKINYDDPDYIGDASPIDKGLTRDNIVWAFTTTHAANWHPLTWLSLELDAEIYTRMMGAAKAGGFHLNNLLLHMASTVVLFVALRRMTGMVWPSALVAALFGVHPLHVESVAWISERKDVLSTLFWMLTLWCYAAYVERLRWWRYLLVVTVFVLGLMAKPMLVTLPCVLLLLDYWPLRRFKSEIRNPKSETNSKDQNQKSKTEQDQSFGSFGFGGLNLFRISDFGFRILEKLPLFAFAAASCVVTWYAQQKSGAVQSLDRFSLGVRAANALAAYAGYLRKTFWPTDLALFYPHPGESLPWWQAAGAALLLVTITALALWQARRRPYLIVGWLWFVGTLVPVIGLVQVGGQAMADRYTYVPHVGLFIMFAWALADLVAGRPALRVVATMGACLLIVVCMVLTTRQCFTWHNSITLWNHALQVTEDNYRAHYLLGLALVEFKPKEETPAQHLARLREATEHFERAVELRPNDASYQMNIGVFFEDQWGRTEDALRYVNRAVQLQPDSPLANYNKGKLLEKLGRLDEAETHLRTAVAAQDDIADVHKHLGQVLIKRGKAQAAADSFRRALEQRPGDIVLRISLADALHEAGQTEEAAALFREASQEDPQLAGKFREAAWKLATSKNGGKRDPREAVRQARLASQAVGGRDPEYLDTLAAAHAAAGDFSRAEKTARDALALADGNRTLAETIAGRLRLYEKKVAFEQGN
jgi:tetratricopeptide (TPR) repeat protein